MSPISKSVFKRFLDALPIGKVAQKIANTERGQRLWPSQTSKNDQKYNFRADKGSTLPDGSQEIVFQANKNAETRVFDRARSLRTGMEAQGIKQNSHWLRE
ncbi:hypothetical protein P3342_004873 [Pyrenophora teres f. teres]|uniref:Uncharacterized protein n=2 Tax=Pyrenophora teres f. teres TaxID=97479 RepID=E3RI31_PYRTT|nr:hypothetical protein PTT_07632 [Pyrenophora teres f. teres 0-1]KAE8846464.1 hypothetical protein HRS9139_01031 [Pyrenophora teres f. teres]KAE8848605.1 hypothetical protein PTNB85_02448 [Pyrenophora teres f. teres]KAE8853225.1 hypothetical protein HRS9122_00217 [Pyrenophora teres f. teres]KAE8868531.1 hypothetical protein PTNB29_02442 [Pyrenophora teres f. teres]